MLVKFGGFSPESVDCVPDPHFILDLCTGPKCILNIHHSSVVALKQPFLVLCTLEWDDFPKSFQNRLPTSLVIPMGTQSYHKKLWPTGLHTRLPIGGQSFTTMAIK